MCFNVFRKYFSKLSFTVNHLLLHCKLAYALWCEVFHVFGVHRVMLKTVKSLFFVWENWFGKQQSTIWNMIPGWLLWLVWQEQNNHIFEDNERSLDLLKHLLFGTLFQWARIWGLTQCISIFAFYNLLADSFSSWAFCIFVMSRVFIIMNAMFIFSIKVLLPIKKISYPPLPCNHLSLLYPQPPFGHPIPLR